MRHEHIWNPESKRLEVATAQPVLSTKVLVTNAAGNILLLMRAGTDAHRPSTFDLPGGGPNYGETPQTAAARELVEEIRYGTAVDARNIAKLADTLHPFRSLQYRSKDGAVKRKELYVLQLSDKTLAVQPNPAEHEPAAELWVAPQYVSDRLGQPQIAQALAGLVLPEYEPVAARDVLPEPAYEYREARPCPLRGLIPDSPLQSAA